MEGSNLQTEQHYAPEAGFVVSSSDQMGVPTPMISQFCVQHSYLPSTCERGRKGIGQDVRQATKVEILCGSRL